VKLKSISFAALVLSLGMATPGIGVAAAPHEGRQAGVEAGPGGWDEPPREFREIQRQGFHDGIEGARKDFDNHRPPNVNNREEYRHPHVSPSARDDYREGFRRGYDVAMNHLTGH
jgi:hypothetical protein